MKKIHYLLIFSLAITVIACGYQKEEAASSGNFDVAYEAEDRIEMMEAPYEENLDVSPAADVRFASNSTPIERKVIKTADLNMQVTNLDSAKANINKLLRNYNAYVGADNRNNDHYRLTLEMTIRVQQDQMDALLQNLLAQASYVHYNNINAQDVTEEFVDINIRLKNKKAVEEQYVKLLQRATKVEDVLKVENELRMIREEIEAKEGRLNFLNSQVNMATIHLRAYQDIYEVNQAPAKSFWLKMEDGFADGWELLKNIILVIIHGWPLILGALVIGVVIRSRYRRYKIKKLANS